MPIEMPKVKSVLHDPTKKITYEVMAYRPLTREELVMSVRYFRSTKAGRRVRKNTTYTIVSIIGHNDPP